MKKRKVLSEDKISGTVQHFPNGRLGEALEHKLQNRIALLRSKGASILSPKSASH